MAGIHQYTDTLRAIGNVAAANHGMMHGEDPWGLLDIEFPTLIEAAEFAAWCGLTNAAQLRDPVTTLFKSVVLQFTVLDWYGGMAFRGLRQGTAAEACAGDKVTLHPSAPGRIVTKSAYDPNSGDGMTYNLWRIDFADGYSRSVKPGTEIWFS